MAVKDDFNEISKSFAEFMPHLQKCDYCTGKDGKPKDIYENFQLAFDTAKFIEEDRGIYLNVYKCPHGNGWHLSKNNASSEIIERKETLFQNNDIPLSSLDGTWEFIKEEGADEFINNNYTEIAVKNNAHYSIPIIKVECESIDKNIKLSGEVMEIVKNVNIEKAFGLNLQNIFCTSLVKNILDGIVNQITIYVENKEKNHLESYTLLVKNDLLNIKTIKRGDTLKIDITSKLINKIKVWCCNKVYK